MAALAEPAFISEQAKKEEKNRKREAKNKERELQKKNEEKEAKIAREKELRDLAAKIKNNGQNNKQLQRAPVYPAVASASAKVQPQAPKAHVVNAVQTPLPAAAKITVPTSSTHASTVHPTPVSGPNRATNASQTQKVAVPSTPVAPKMSNINHYQPAAIVYIGQIPVNTNMSFGRKETQATPVVEKTQATSAVVTYATILQTKPVNAQKTSGTHNAAASTGVSMTTTTTLPVVPQTNQPAKEKVAVQRPMFSTTTTTSVSSERSHYTGTQRNSNGPNQKDNGNGRVTNGGANGSGQKYYGNGSGQRYNGNVSRYNGNGSGQRYKGNGYGRRYHGNGRYNNGSQKKQAKPKPVIDADGFQLVQY